MVRPSRLWVLGLVSLCGIYVQFVLATWGPLFFTETGVQTLGRAGTYASLQGVAAVGGLVAGGFADDWMRRRGSGHTVVIGVGLAALSVSVGAMAGAIVSRSLVGLLVALFFSAFFCWSIWAAVYALLGELVSGERLATAFGFLNTMSFLGAVVGPPLTGWVRDVAGSFAPGCPLAAGVALVGAITTLGLRMPPAPLRADVSSPAHS